MLLDGKDTEQREQIEAQLWSDPDRERKILAALGAAPAGEAVTVIEE